MNEQKSSKSVLESVVDSNVLIVSEGATIATNTTYQAAAQANAIALQNSVISQSNLNTLYPAIVATITKMINNA